MPWHHYFVWLQSLLLQLLGHTHCDHTAVPAATATAAALLVLAPVALLLGHTYHCCTRCHCCPFLGNTCTAVLAATALHDSMSSISYIGDTSMRKAEKFRMENGGRNLGDGNDIASSRRWRTKFEGGKKVD
ncbi:hypothetical protein DFH07DRAFT_772235 [Mycena maculata]|uniref:Uncharacterized protein n=1 Tax=Mycena maculata TaxID=230809 RepID=A0AAD7NGX9_9AGAR|nr:hypothetical protein DFH07DRAFT_772235 [Mycena maculata]